MFVDGPVRKRGDQRGGHSDARRRAVFRSRAFGNVDMNVRLGEDVFVNAQFPGARLGKGVGRDRRLAHHVAQLTRELQSALALHRQRLMKRMSPPVAVTANPVATPIWSRFNISSGSILVGPRNSLRFLTVTLTCSLSPSATRRATLRQIFPISRSSWRRPDSRVYFTIESRSAGSEMVRFSGLTPFSSSCFGSRWRRTICNFSSSV